MKKTKERQSCELCRRKKDNGTCVMSPNKRVHPNDWCSYFSKKKEGQEMTDKQGKEVERLSTKINELLNQGGVSLSVLNRERRKLNALYSEIREVKKK